jgi:hypothetical protein
MPGLIALALRNWRPVGVGLLLLAIGVQTFRLNLSERTVERQRNQIAEVRAENGVLRASVAAMIDAGNRQREAFERAVREGNETIRQGQRAAGRVRVTPANGCPTPPEILSAPL